MIRKSLFFVWVSICVSVSGFSATQAKIDMVLADSFGATLLLKDAIISQAIIDGDQAHQQLIDALVVLFSNASMEIEVDQDGRLTSLKPILTNERGERLQPTRQKQIIIDKIRTAVSDPFLGESAKNVVLDQLYVSHLFGDLERMEVRLINLTSDDRYLLYKVILDRRVKGSSAMEEMLQFALHMNGRVDALIDSKGMLVGLGIAP